MTPGTVPQSVRDGSAFAPVAPPGFRADPPPPVDRLVIGRTVKEALALVPCLFALCRAAQDAALRAALGIGGADPAALRAEILRDHLLLLFNVLPARMGLGARPLPPDWRAGGPALGRALFGPAGTAPGADDLGAWLGSGHGAAPVLRHLSTLFAPGAAVAEGLDPPRRAADGLAHDPFENSVAGRMADHPAMRAAERRWGRGPLWRVLGRVCECGALIEGAPCAMRVERTVAAVPATRGTLSLRAEARAGHITRFERTTPTDHLLAPGGVMARTLAALPADGASRLDLVIAILDPCVPLRRVEAAHA